MLLLDCLVRSFFHAFIHFLMHSLNLPPSQPRTALTQAAGSPTRPAQTASLHQHGSCRSFLLSDKTHASPQLLFRWGLAYEQGILFSEFLVKIFHLIKVLQPALFCVCQKVEARATLSSAPWEAGSRSLWGEPSPSRGGRVPRPQGL